jgi:hypothetical protein
MTTLVLAHVASSGVGVLGLPVWVLGYLVAAVLAIVVLVARASLLSGPAPGADDTVPAETVAPAPHKAGAFGSVATTLGLLVTTALLAITLVLAFFGPRELGANAAPGLVFTIFWVGGAWLALLLGDVWWRIDPYLAFGRLCDRVRRARAARTPGGDPDAVPDVVRRWWTAPLVLATFVIIWTADPLGDQPRRLATWLLGFSVIVGVGAIQSGVRGVADLDPFPSVFGLAARMWPWARSRDPSTGGRAGTDPTRAGGADLRTTLALASLVAAATFFDRLKGTLVFLRTVKVRTPFTAWLENVLVLVWAAGLVAALWWGLGLIGSRILRTSGRADDQARSDGAGGTPGLLLAASLGPIAMSALLAHTFNTLLVQVQNVLVLASDPFARGQDLFGTVNWRIHAPLSVRADAWVQLAIITFGHAAAIWIVRGTCQAAAVPATGRARRSDRQRSLRAALPAFGVIIVSGIAWTLLLLGA